VAPSQKKWLVLTAAVAAVVVTVGFSGQFYRAAVPAESQPPAPTETLTLISPLGRVTLPFDFRWASVIEEPAYRIEVFDAGGGAIAARVLRTGRLAATDLRPDWKPASYTWKITLFDSKGVFVMASPLQPFEIAAP
jgi:hypothetical protein